MDFTGYRKSASTSPILIGMFDVVGNSTEN